MNQAALASNASRRRRGAARLAPLLMLAALLRFTGLAHDLRYVGPNYDERQNHLDPVDRMLAIGSPDPTVLQGYAGFFNWLIWAPVAVGERLDARIGAGLAARGVVAGFSTLSVLFAYIAAEALAGDLAGLFAAALLAVSPLEVRSSHYVTPDVLVGTGLLGLLALLARRGRGLASGPGAILGLTTAVKYTGALLAPAVAVELWIRRGSARDVLRTLAVALGAFVLAAPFAVSALLRSTDASPARVLADYYGAAPQANRFLHGGGSALPGVAAALLHALGPLGAALALVAYPLARDRRLLPAGAAVAAGLLVTAPANLVYPRHVIPLAAAAAVLAGVAAAALARRLGAGRLGLLALAAACAVSPGRASVRHVLRFTTPTATTRAGSWLERQRDGPALVATWLDRLRLDPARFEVRNIAAVPELPPSLLVRYDLLVAGSAPEADRLVGFRSLARFDGQDESPPVIVSILEPVAGRRPRLEPAPRPAALRASAPGAEWAFDGDPASSFRAAPGGFVELAWREAVLVDSVEALAGPDGEPWPLPATLWGSRDGASFERLEVEPLRPSRRTRQRPNAPGGQSFVLTPPVSLSALRFVHDGAAEWGVSELRVLTTQPSRGR